MNFKKTASVVVLIGGLLSIVWGLNNIYLQKEVYAKDKELIIAGLETFREETVKQFQQVENYRIEQSKQNQKQEAISRLYIKKYELVEYRLRLRELLLRYPNDANLNKDYEDVNKKIQEVNEQIISLEIEININR